MIVEALRPLAGRPLKPSLALALLASTAFASTPHRGR